MALRVTVAVNLVLTLTCSIKFFGSMITLIFTLAAEPGTRRTQRHYCHITTSVIHSLQFRIESRFQDIFFTFTCVQKTGTAYLDYSIPAKHFLLRLSVLSNAVVGNKYFLIFSNMLLTKPLLKQPISRQNITMMTLFFFFFFRSVRLTYCRA